MDWGKWLVNFNAVRTQLVSFDWSNNNGSIDVKIEESVLEEKSSFKMLQLTFSFKLDWGSYIIYIAKTASRKIGPYESTIRPCMKSCCHVWAGVPSCHLKLLDKLQKGICRTVGHSLAASLELLAHC